MTQIRTIISESLEAKVRELLPSQAGFTEELQAQNQIVPVIDLTAAAEGSSTPEYLQRAWDFATGYTSINSGTTTSLITNTGFWQLALTFSSDSGNSARSASIYIDDGTTEKVVWELNKAQVGTNDVDIIVQDKFVVFLRAGDTLKADTVTAGTMFLDVWYRQVATVTGTLVNPLDFSPQ